MELISFEQLLRMMMCIGLPWSSGVDSRASDQQHGTS